MRRTENYRTDFETASGWRAAGKLEEAGEDEKMSCIYWRIESGPLPDPAKSWEELSREEQIRLFLFSKAIRFSAAVMINYIRSPAENAPDVAELLRGRFIVIEPSKAKSIGQLKKDICREIDLYCEMHPELAEGKPKKSHKGKRNWERIFKAGDLISSGKDIDEIIEVLFPGTRSAGQRESARVKTEQALAEYRRIIQDEGAARAIFYP